MLSKNTKKNGCLNICKLESENPSYYQKKYFKTKWSKVSSEFPKQFHKKFYKSGKPFTGKEGDVLIFNPLLHSEIVTGIFLLPIKITFESFIRI